MSKEGNKVDQVIECYLMMRGRKLREFCDKQKLKVFGVIANSQHEVICFSPELRMSFRDIFLDLCSGVESGVAIKYMQGFDMDMDNAAIDKELSYKEYLESKKLI
jgi:hypothetical protein